MRRILAAAALTLAALAPAAAQPSITWTQIWPPANDGTHNPWNGYQDVVWDAYTGKLWVYSTAVSGGSDGIYSDRLHYFDPVAVTDTNIGDNGQTVAGPCLASTATWPPTHHAVGMFWVDAIRHRLYTTEGVACSEINLEQWYFPLTLPISGNAWTEVYPPGLATDHAGEHGAWWKDGFASTLSAGISSGATQITLAAPGMGVDRDFYLIDSEIVRVTAGGGPMGIFTSGTNPLTILRGQYGTTAASHANGATVSHMSGVSNDGRIVHDTYDDAFFWFGNVNSNSYGQLFAYCDSNGTGTLSANQTTVGCARPDDWTDITSKSICAGAGCTASIETGTNGPNSGKVPQGWYYPSLDYDDSTHTLLDWGGAYGCCTAETQAYRYTPQTFTWTSIATTCTGADCVGSAPALYSSNGERFRVAHAVFAGKYYYHYNNQAAANYQDWELDPNAGSWTELDTGTGPTLTETMTVDPATGTLYSWGSSSAGADAEIWKGVIVAPPVITSSSPLPAGQQYAAYSVTLTATGSPTSWAIIGGSLPPGLSLRASTGVISGTSNLGGSWSITVRATNAAGTSSPATLTLPITVTPGLGASTYNCVDADGDGYGVGAGCVGPDADDTDATVHSAADALTKYGTLAAFWSHMGWNPTHVVYVDGGSGSCTPIAAPFTYSSASGCGTIPAAIAAASLGYAVVLRGGTYDGGAATYNLATGTQSGGSCTAWMYYLAYPGELPDVEFEGGEMGINNPSPTLGGCTLVDGIKWNQNTIGTGRGFAANFAYPAYSLIITHNEISGFTDNIFPQYNQHNDVIAHNYVHNAWAGGDLGHGIYLGSDVPDSSGTVIRANVIADAEDTCLHVNGAQTNITIDSNLIYGCAKAVNLSSVASSLIQNNIIHTNATPLLQFNDYTEDYVDNSAWQCKDMTNNRVVFNSFIDDGQSWLTPFGGHSVTTDGGWPVIEIADTPGQGETTDCAVQAGRAVNLGGNVYSSNILMHNCGGACSDYNGPIIRYAPASESPAWLATDTYRNNVLMNSQDASAIIDPLAGGFGAAKACSWFTNTSNVPLASGNLCNVDPQFTAVNPSGWAQLPGNWNMHVRPGSPALGAGYAADAPAYDAIGVPRSATAPSAGAYELSALVASGSALSGKMAVSGGVVIH